MKHLLTVMDGYTKYARVCPVPDQKKATIINALLETWIFLFGCPESIHSDNGSAFISEVYKGVMSCLGIKRVLGVPHCPESNQVERFHRTLFGLIRSNNDIPESHWVDKSFSATFAYNTSVHRMTGVTPYRAVFGTEARLPLDLMLPTPNQPRMTSTDRYVRELKERFRQIYQDIRTRQLAITHRSHLNDLRYADTEQSQLADGDLVYIYDFGPRSNTSKKIQRRWIGPYEIDSKISPSLVKIKRVGDGLGETFPINVNKIKKSESR